MDEEMLMQRRNLFYNVAWLRRHYGISKKRMAQLLGIGVGTLNKLEQGKMPPKMSVMVLHNIRTQFSVSLDDLFGKRLDDLQENKNPPCIE